MLLLGGPLHGQERELSNGETELVVMAPSPGNPIPTPFKYQVKTIQAETRPGVVYSRKVLVEQSMPVEVAAQGLAQVLVMSFAQELVRQFMEGGTLVDNLDFENGTSGIDPGTNSTPSGIIIGK